MNEPLLRIESLTRRYGGLIAVNDVSFEVARGEIVGIMGANGAGKTTLFAMIAGNVPPSSGRISLEGRRIDGLRPDVISRAGVARTFQIVRPFPDLTAIENVTVAALYGARRMTSRAQAEALAAALLEEVGLGTRTHSLARDLTLAGRKRLEVARALATGARLLMLDEVLAGLTGAEVAASLDLIQKLHERYGLTILVIEHVMRALMRLSQRIVVLHHGVKIAEGSPAAIAENESVHSAYFGAKRNAVTAA
jgi:branched-chain amino acid transport system ATP-binding protein